jgi:hypothetical protein
MVFNRAYRLEIQSVMLVFSTQLCELLPLCFVNYCPSNLLSCSPPIPPFSKSKYSIYRQCVAVLGCVGDHILQEFNTLYSDSEHIQNCLTISNKNLGG